MPVYDGIQLSGAQGTGRPAIQYMLLAQGLILWREASGPETSDLLVHQNARLGGGALRGTHVDIKP